MLLKLRRLVEHRRSFTLCLLTYSDSAYRNTAASFLAGLLDARLHVAIDPVARVGTEELFERLGDDEYGGPVQLSGLEQWPEGLDNLLRRLNYRREALAARCRRPLLTWIRARDVRAVATGAADVWAWCSGVFDFTLPAFTDRLDSHSIPIDRYAAESPKRRERLAEVQRYLGTRPTLRQVDVDLLIEMGDLQQSEGETFAAERSYSSALQALAVMDDHRRRAIARGRIAGILQARGDLDEALRIRTEEEIPVYERLGDARLLAIAKGRVADILEARGALIEALRIRVEEEIPVYERVGDRRSLAVTKGKIADILQVRGEPDEALRIRIEEEIPVYKLLDDARSLAIARGKVAGILQARGELDEALRIRIEEEIPVYELLGDRRSLAITKGKIADILQVRGELDEALRIRLEEEIPVYERLGDARSLAIARGKIADILQVRDELAEALRVYTEELLPVFGRMGDTRSLAVTNGRIADLRQARGELDEALRIRTEQEIPVYERLGDARSLAITKGKVADVRQAKGELDEALRIRIEEEIPVYERLGDARAAAIAKGRAAGILEARDAVITDGPPSGQRTVRIQAFQAPMPVRLERRTGHDDLGEALRIRTEEEIPVYERLGDARAAAITKGRVAGILEARGELAEALRIRTGQEIPVYERLGDRQSLAAAGAQVKRLRNEIARRTRSGSPAPPGDLQPARSPGEAGRRGADAAQVAR